MREKVEYKDKIKKYMEKTGMKRKIFKEKKGIRKNIYT